MRPEDVLFAVASVLYFVASVLFGGLLIGRVSVERVQRIGPWLIAAGVVAHGFYIVRASFVLRVCPVNGIHFPMSIVALLMCIAYLIMSRRARVEAVGAFVAPLALTTLFAARFVGLGHQGIEPSQRMKGLILPIHVTMNMLGVALFALAFAAATLYLVQERLIKRKRVDGLFQRLPPLEALDRAEHRFLLFGFPLLTMGIITGTLWARNVEMGNAEDLLRAAFGYITWLVFGAVLLLRAAAGWRGRRAAYGTIAGFFCSVIVLLFYVARAGSGPQPIVPPHADLAPHALAPHGGTR